MGPRPDLSQFSDPEVVALALKRQEGAWVELVHRHKERVRWIIGRQVGTAEHVEQLAQDTFFKAAMFLEDYRRENSFAGWMSAIAYHTAVDYDLVARHAKLIVDTRGVYREARPNVVKA